jgi:copper chaperone CopZ
MKKKCRIAALAAAAAAWILLAGCATPRADTSRPPDAPQDLSSYRRVILTVYGLSCPLCSNNLDGRLRRIQGVEKSQIDLQTGAVEVWLAENHWATPDAIAQAVEDAGFTLKSIEPAPDPQ